MPQNADTDDGRSDTQPRNTTRTMPDTIVVDPGAVITAYQKNSTNTNSQYRIWVYEDGHTDIVNADDHEMNLVADANKVGDVLRVFELRDQELSYRKIAEHVPWSPPTVGKLLNRRDEYEAVVEGAKLGYQL